MKKIEISPYDPKWVIQFQIESEKIKLALKDTFTSIHHVGSTSVPGLSTKPIIDIIAEVNHLNFDHMNLLKLQYEYRGGFNLPMRKCFTYRSVKLNINLHCFEQDDPEIELNLMFRDYLQQNKIEKEMYEKLKYNLISNETPYKTDGYMFKNYTLGKHDFIQQILKKSGFNKIRFVICSHYTERDAVKAYRDQYFEIKNKSKDPYELTFNHENHKHFVLYEGTQIIGYAHIQLLLKQACIKMIIVDNQQAHTKFMQLIEKWSTYNNYQIYSLKNHISST